MALRAVGDVLAAKYRIDALLGSGGMGDVYRATNVLLNREVAIKIMHLKHAEDPNLLQRFLREARVANVVRHPNVVDVLDVDQDTDGSPFIVQELLYGEDLARYMRERGRLSLDEVRTLIVPIVEAVAQAHLQGVIHRDLKPANIFLANLHGPLESPPSSAVAGRRAPKSGMRIVPKLLDFGVAKLRASDVRTTDVGELLGTPAYMAPELLHGVHDANAQSDVWALGVMLFELLAGRRPFTMTGPAIYVAVATTDAPSLAAVAPDVDPEVAAIVDRCLLRSVTERFATAAELATALAETLDAASGRASRPSLDPSAHSEPLVPELALPRTLAGSDATTVDLVPPSLEGTLASRLSAPRQDVTERMAAPPPSLPEAPELGAPSVRPEPVPSRPPGVSMRPPRSGSGLMLDAPPRASLPPPDMARGAANARHEAKPKERATAEVAWLKSLLVLGVLALGTCGALTATIRTEGGFAIVRPLVETSAPITMAVQVAAALVAAALAARMFRSAMRQWQGPASAPAIAYAVTSGGLLFVALKLLRAA